MAVTRREALGGLGAALAFGLVPGLAEASVARGLTLEVLSTRSDHIAVATPLSSSCRYEVIGGRRRIVTDTRLRVDEPLAKAEPGDSELFVCTLGGVLDGVGELVHGEAELVLEQRAVVFLRRRADGLHVLQGMAQGHYPLSLEANRARLRVSPRLAEIARRPELAVERLQGRELAEARRLIREALAR